MSGGAYGAELIGAVAAFAGLLVGSFIGLLTLRLPADRPVLVGRSKCDGCGRKLGPADLVPLASWLALRGRCRTCRAAIPRRYPLLEAGCALVGLWAALVDPGPAVFASAVLGWWLLLLAVLDGESFWLPRRLTVPLLLTGLAAAAWLRPESLADRAIGAAVGWAALTLIGALYERVRRREGLGGGDPPFLAAIGAWVGWAGLPSVLLIAAAAGLAWAVVAGRGRPRADLKLPFGVFLAIGAWLVWLYGPIGLGRV